MLSPHEGPRGREWWWRRKLADPPCEPAILGTLVEAVVVVPVAAPGPAPEAQVIAEWAPLRVERRRDDVAGVGPLVGMMAFIEASRSELARGAIRIFPGIHRFVVEVTAEEEVHVVREEPLA